MDIVIGAQGELALEKRLAEHIQSFHDEGTIYIGYPIIALEDARLRIDVLFTSKRYGLIAFDLDHFASATDSIERNVGELQANLYAALTAKMLESSGLRRGRKLAVEPIVLSIHQSESRAFGDGTLVSTFNDLERTLADEEALDSSTYEHLNALVQRSSTLRPKKRRENIRLETSIGAKLKKIEREIANLDAHQKRAAIEMPNGPQRIRGLAGSGKTIVLAQKAAFLHTSNPDWRIVVTFQTRSLYQQLIRLITQFTFETVKEEPDWSKLSVMHAWGGVTTQGVYSELSQSIGMSPTDFQSAKRKYGANKAFEGVCDELLKLGKGKFPEIYDAVLIDEAQDLPRSFFELSYEATRSPNRVVYAYDELQNLSDFEMRPPEELFGNKDNGRPRVTLNNRPNLPKQDLILPVCYRNPPWVLSSAHSLGFGVYREKGLVQMFEDTDLWAEIGYRSANGAIALGQHVAIKRDEAASPHYFSELLDKENSLYFRKFDTRDKEREWLKAEIKKNLEDDELDPDDILIIVADPFQVRSEASALMKLFANEELGVHLPGVTASVDQIFQENSIAVTSIYRAKGNEAPMVYVVGAEHCAAGFELSKKRNILFTAMTRSRGWLRVSGVGDEMQILIDELSAVKQNDDKLEFDYPTAEGLKTIRTLHRDRRQEDRELIETDLDSMARLLQRIESGDMTINELPLKVQKQLRGLLGQGE